MCTSYVFLEKYIECTYIQSEFVTISDVILHIYISIGNYV